MKFLFRSRVKFKMKWKVLKLRWRDLRNYSKISARKDPDGIFPPKISRFKWLLLLEMCLLLLLSLLILVSLTISIEKNCLINGNTI